MKNTPGRNSPKFFDGLNMFQLLHIHISICQKPPKYFITLRAFQMCNVFLATGCERLTNRYVSAKLSVWVESAIWAFRNHIRSFILMRRGYLTFIGNITLIQDAFLNHGALCGDCNAKSERLRKWYRPFEPSYCQGFRTKSCRTRDFELRLRSPYDVCVVHTCM